MRRRFDGDIIFGSVASRQLHLSLYAPWQFKSYTDEKGFWFDWRRLANPVRWWRTIFRRENWEFWMRWWKHINHRCYCQNENDFAFDGHIVVAGWGLVWWYSRYTGEVPCTCDKIIAEMFPDEDEECETASESAQ